MLRFPCEQYHTEITNWISNLWETSYIPPYINLSELIAKQVPCQPGLYSKQEPSVRTLWPDIKMMVSLTKLIVLFAKAEPISLSASPSHLKTRKLENNFAPPQRLLEHFPEGDDAGAFIVPALDARSQVVLENLCSNLHLFGSAQLTLVAPDLCVPGVPEGTTSHLSSQYGKCVMAALSRHHFFAAWRVEAPFSAVSLSDGSFTLRFL